MRNRETIIALRAGRTAHRVASDVLYPPVATPPQHVMSLEEPGEFAGEPVVPVAELLATANANPPMPAGRTRWGVLAALWIVFWMTALVIACAVFK